MIFMHIKDGKLLMSAYDDIESAKKDIKGLFYKLQTDTYISQEFFDKVLKPNDAKEHSIAHVDSESYYVYVHKNICDNCKHRMACMLDGKFNGKNETVYKCDIKALRMKAKGAKIKEPQAVITINESPIMHGKITDLHIQMFDYAKALAEIHNLPKDVDRIYEDIVYSLAAQTNYLSQKEDYKDIKYIRLHETFLPIVALRSVLLYITNNEGILLIMYTQAIKLESYTIL